MKTNPRFSMVPAASSSPDAELAEALERYLADLEAGKAPDIEEYLKRHPRVADRLRKCLESLRCVEQAGGRLEPTDLSDPRQRTLGDYRLIREIGRGGMGIVYEAEQLSLQRHVALKVLPFAAVLDANTLKRFASEAHAAAALQHPNIVSVYAAGQQHGVHYYTMELVEGQSLSQVLALVRDPIHDTTPDTGPAAILTSQRRSQPDKFYRSVAHLGVQVSQGLDYAHRMGVVHRDIKPSNLLLDQQGKPWITDFGLAVTNAEGTLTLTGDLVGTLRYMSPEQASGSRTVLDHRTDIYSLGATLYELLTLQPAFMQADRQELLQRIGQQDPPAPRSIQGDIPKDLETIVLKAMAKDADRRYASCQELADDLQRFLDDRPILARRSSRVTTLKRLARRNPLSACLTALSLILLLTLAIAGPLIALHEAHLSRTIRTELYVSDMGRAWQAWDDANLAEVRHLLARWNDADDLCGFEYRLLSTQLAALDATPIARHASRVRAVAISPTSRVIASGCEDGSVRLWMPQPEGPQLIRTLQEHALVTSLAFSPQNDWLAIGTQDRGVLLRQHADGSEVRRLTLADVNTRCLAFSPDGRYLAIGGCRETKKNVLSLVTIWDCVTSQFVAELEGHIGTVFSIAFSSDGKLLATGGSDHTVRLWNAESWQLHRTLPNDYEIFAVAFSRDGNTFAAGGYNYQIRLWNTSTWTDLLTLRARGHSVRALAFSRDSRTLASGGIDNLVKLWDVAAGTFLGDIRGHAAEVNAVAFFDDGETLASGSNDETMRIQTVGHVRQDPPKTERGISKTCLALSPRGDVLATTSSIWESPRPGSIHVMHLVSRQSIVLENMPKSSLKAVACSDQIVAAAGGCLSTGEGEIWLWDAHTGARLQPLVGHRGGVESLAINPTGDLLAAGDWNGEIRVWHLPTRKQIQVFDTRNDVAAALAFDPRGDILAAAVGKEHEQSGDRWQDTEVQLWSISQGIELAPLRGTTNIATGLTFSPDGSTLATGDLDKTIMLWDLKRRTPRVAVASHWVTAVVFSPDGKTLASGGSDGNVHLWHVATGGELATLTNACTVTSVIFSRDGQTLAAGYVDRTIKLWHASADKRNWPTSFHANH